MWHEKKIEPCSFSVGLVALQSRKKVVKWSGTWLDATRPLSKHCRAKKEKNPPQCVCVCLVSNSNNSRHNGNISSLWVALVLLPSIVDLLDEPNSAPPLIFFLHFLARHIMNVMVYSGSAPGSVGKRLLYGLFLSSLLILTGWAAAAAAPRLHICNNMRAGKSPSTALGRRLIISHELEVVTLSLLDAL